MKEFKKIYIAKYMNVETINQLAEDLKVSQEEIKNTINELKETGMDKVYKNISDYEWEKLEKKTDENIRKKYMPLSKENSRRAYKELIKLFSKHERKRVEFEIFDEIKWKIKGLKDKVIVDEEWKQIPGCLYSISNYGRVRNDKNKKIKQVRFDKYLIRTDIYKNNKKYTVNVCRLEAELFIRKLNKDERVIHKDGDSRNNYYKNLEIVSK